MNNRMYHALNNPIPYNDNVSYLNPYQDTKEQFDHALIETMRQVNSHFFGGYGITYYNSFLDPSCVYGYANNEYWDVIAPFTFQMKPGKRPSDAIMAFLRGLTVADCGNVVSICQLTALLKVLGEEKFNAIFSDPYRPLFISPYINGQVDGKENVASLFLKSENLNGNYNLGVVGNRPIQQGEMCQIWGIPEYSIKHPGNFSRLYNTICIGKNEAGKDLFIGFADFFSDKALTEEEFMLMFINAYNADRDILDLNAIQASGTPWLFDMDSRHVKEKLTLEEGLREVIGFMPNLKVTPAYEMIRHYQNMPIAQIINPNASNISYPNEETVMRRPEPTPLSSDTSSNPHPEENGRRRRHIFCRLFHHHHWENKRPEETNIHTNSDTSRDRPSLSN